MLFGLFCKTYNKDLKTFMIFKQSVDKFNVDNIPLFVVCPEKDLNFIKKEVINGLESYNITFISDEIVLEENNINIKEQSWISQQLIKLGFYKLNLVKYYAIFDSDCYFIQNFYLKDFLLTEGTPFLHLEISESYDQNQKIKDFFKRRGANFSFIFHSQVFSSEVLRSMEKEILQPRGWTWYDLLKICPYEFNWYGEYYLMYNKGSYDYKPSKGVAFWSQKQYRNAQISGLSVSDFIKDGKIFICLNNGWVKDSKYQSLLIFVILRKIINYFDKFYDKYYKRDSKFFKLSKINRSKL